MEELIQQFRRRLDLLSFDFKRYLYDKINWRNRLIAIVGARGVGKTTLILQHIKETFTNLDEVIYVSLDHLYFSRVGLLEFADRFVKNGGKFLFLDEVHKYPGWSVEIKNIYDLYPDLHVVVTGSSALQLHKGKADLSRRMLFYKMRGLSLREFVRLKYGISLPVYDLEEIVTNAGEISKEINGKIKPLKVWNEYLREGYYPFFTEGDRYDEKLAHTVNEIIENDLPALTKINYTAVYKLKKLLMIMASLAPFKPNILKLSRQTDINRETLLKYLVWLQQADLLLLLYADTKGIAKMNKPEKVYLNNPNLYFALAIDTVNKGTLRETFVANQLSAEHAIVYAGKGDFLVDNKYYFEVGGKNKGPKQIAGLSNAYILSDDIEYAYQQVIPVWLFGFLY